MNDQGDHRGDAANPDPRHDPADGPVVKIHDLPKSDDTPLEAEAKPAIDSRLVGEGGLAAAERKSEAGDDAVVPDEEQRPEPWQPFDPVDDAPPVVDKAPVDDARPVGDEAPVDDARLMDVDGPVDAARPFDEDGPVDAARPSDAERPVDDTRRLDDERVTDAGLTDDPPRSADSGPRPSERLGGPPILPPPLVPAPRRSGFWPALFGGVIAAGLGAGAMYFLLDGAATAPVGLTPEAEAAAREIATTAAGTEVEARTAALTDAARAAGTAAGTEAAQAALAAAPAEAPADTAALEAQGARIQSLEARLTALADRPAATAPGQTATGASAPDDLASLRADLQAQAARIAELAARPAFDAAAVTEVQRIAADIASQRQAIDTRLAEAGQQADAIAGKVEEAGRRVSSTAALAALESALVNGSDGITAAAQLQAAGVQPPAPLTRPIPALADLQRDFPDAARAGLRAARDDAATGGGLGNFLRVQTGARSVEAREGSDPDAVLSRAGAAVEAGDIAAALTEIATLPASAQAAMTGWTGPATDWSAGEQAATALKVKP